MRRIIALGILLAACGWSCSATPPLPDPRIEAAKEYAREVTGDDLKASGLSVSVRSAVADGRYVRINGTVDNRFDQPVEGIRYTVHFMAAGDEPRILETVRQETDTRLDPGQDRSMRIEIEHPIRASSGGRIEVLATPIRIGGKEQPLPPGWP